MGAQREKKPSRRRGTYEGPETWAKVSIFLSAKSSRVTKSSSPLPLVAPEPLELPVDFPTVFELRAIQKEHFPRCHNLKRETQVIGGKFRYPNRVDCFSWEHQEACNVEPVSACKYRAPGTSEEGSLQHRIWSERKMTATYCPLLTSGL